MQTTIVTDNDQRSLRIRTTTATWTYQLDAGGFSSVRDVEDIEWIGFSAGEPQAPAGAADVFRGIPNLVFPDNLGHPGYRGCRTTVIDQHDTCRLLTQSLDKKWEWEWMIYEQSATLDVTRSPGDRAYWFLYEGTPAGRFDPQNTFWGAPTGRASADTFSPDGRSVPTLGNRNHPPISARWPWAYVGHHDSPRVIAFVHQSGSDEPSYFGFMRADEKGEHASDGMVVFGFGRESSSQGPTSALCGRHRFDVLFCETTDHSSIIDLIESEKLSRP